jgi:hypothetical protein
LISCGLCYIIIMWNINLIKLSKDIEFFFNQNKVHMKKLFGSLIFSIVSFHRMCTYDEWTSFVTQQLKWVKTTMKKKNICACPNIKNLWQKRFHKKSHNLCDKTKFYTILLSLILWSTFNFVLCSKHIFMGLLLNSWCAFTFSPFCPLCM